MTDADRRARLRLELAAGYFARGQTETALDEVKQALAARPDLPEAYNLRGLIYASLGEAALAEESFQRALQLNPRDADAMHNYGWFLCQQQRYDEAEAQFDAAIAQPQYRDVRAHAARQGRLCRRAPAAWPRPSARCRAPTSSTRPTRPSPSTWPRCCTGCGEFERARFYLRRVNAQPASGQCADPVAGRADRAPAGQPSAAPARWATSCATASRRAPRRCVYDRGRFDD